MKKLNLVALIVLCALVLSCRSHSPPQPDAGPNTSAMSAHPPPKIPGSMVVDQDAQVKASLGRFAALKQYATEHPPPKIEFKKGGPADPRIVACAAKKTWDEFEACSESIKHPPKAAPGLFGASGPPIVCPAQSVPDWYFDPSGNDNNSCTTALTPCSNVTGPDVIESRWGCGGGKVTAPNIGQATVFHVSAAGMALSSHFVINPVIVGAGSFQVIGTTTQTGSGVIGGLIAKNNLAGQPLTVNLTSAASVKNQLFVNTTKGTTAIVDAALSTNVARLSQPINTSTYFEDDTWANGNNYTIQLQPNVYLDSFQPTCSVIKEVFTLPVQPCANRAQLVNVNIPSVALGSATFAGTQLQNVTAINSYIGGVVDARSVWFIGSTISETPYNFQNSALLASTAATLFVTGVGDQYGSYWGSDSYIHGFAVVPPMALCGYDSFWVDPNQELVAQGGLYPQNLINGDGVGFVFANLNPSAGSTVILNQFPGSIMTYNGGTAVNSFSPGLSLQTDMGTNALALNMAEGHDMVRGPRPLTLALLDTPVLSGGFGGLAFNGSLSSGYYNWSFSLPVSVPFSAQPFTAMGAVPSIPNAAVWVRSDFAKLSAGNLTVWRDESGNNYDYNVPSGPIPYVNPWMHFNGAEISPTGGPLGLGDHSTVFLVMRSGGGHNGTIWDNGNLQILDTIPGPSHWGTFVGAYLDSGVNVDDGLPHILVMRTHTVGNIDLITDGVLANFTTGTAYQPRSTNFNEGVAWVGDVAELAAFNADLSNGQVDYVDQYMAAHIGTTATVSLLAPPTVTYLQQTPITTTAPTSLQLLQSTLDTFATAAPGLVTYLDSDIGVTLSGSNVTAWLDQSVNAYSFTQGTIANQPTYTASGGLNGHGYLTYAGANQALNAAVTALTPPFEAFMITDRTGDGYMFDYGSNQSECSITSGSFFCFPTGPAYGAVTTGPHLYNVTWRFPTGIEAVDGVPVLINNLSGSATGSSLTIGNYGGGGNGFNGRYYGLIVYNHALTASQRNVVGGIVNNRWGVSVAGATTPLLWTPVTYHSVEGSAAWTPGLIAPAAAATTTVPFTGALLGQVAAASFSTALPAGVILTAQVTASDVITVTIANLSGSPQTIGAGTVYASLP